MLWLPPSAFTPTLDRKHDRTRPGADSLVTSIAEPKARPYFLTGICKGLFLLSLQQEVPELWRRIIVSIVEIDDDVLQRIWAEMDYRLDICPDTKCGQRTDSFSVHLQAVCYKPFRHLSVQIFWIINNPVSPHYVFCLVKYCIDRII